MKTLAGEIEKAASTLESPEEKDRFISFEQYYSECLTYAPWKDYRPALFNKVPFPSGTLSLIGARTSRGKTASMLNLARELITTPKNTIDQSLKIDSARHILFITLEMSPKQLLTRLALAIAWGISLNNPQHTKLLNRRVTLTGGPLSDYYICLKGEPLQGHSKEETNIVRKYFIDIAIKQYIEPAMKSGQLIIYDARGEKTLDTIMGTVKNRVVAGDIVFLDYIQRLPSSKEDIESYSAAATYMRLKRISDMVFNTAVISGAIIIAGAQFNRASVNGGGNSNNQKTKGDSFSDISFRESGDLEQDAHNAIGIGWTADKQTRFYEVIKARDSGGVGDSYELDWVGAYQYMANTDKLYIASESEETVASIKRKQRDWNNVV
jgi:replicative DNA helicase